jgi:hypothetical protein
MLLLLSLNRRNGVESCQRPIADKVPLDTDKVPASRNPDPQPTQSACVSIRDRAYGCPLHEARGGISVVSGT